MRTAVVLPAPLGPRTPSTVPSSAERSRPARARVSPKRFSSPSARMAGLLPCVTRVPFLWEGGSLQHTLTGAPPTILEHRFYVVKGYFSQQSATRRQPSMHPVLVLRRSPNIHDIT